MSPTGAAASDDTQRRIRALPVVLANQIAAGEVVERPASVAKELLENSLDAGARRIDVEVERGGVALIRVRDDGSGIDRDDLALALDRHATSKIVSLDELERVRTLGFRGEALPSIASVSRFSLSSRRAGDEEGWQIRCDGGQLIGSPEPVSLPFGTSVEVRDLFYNTPARRKFLRTEKTEMRHLEEVVRRIALCRFDVAISLVQAQRTAISVRPAASESDRAARIAKLCGNAFVSNALAIDFDGPELRLWGWTGQAEFSRSQADLQHVFVNGRIVRDALINHAVRQAFEARIPAGRYPAFVLYLDVDPVQVDVNVHPTKHEVRFREARMVHDFIASSLQRALSRIGGDAPVHRVTTPGSYPVRGQGPTRALGDAMQLYDVPQRPTAGNATTRVSAMSAAQIGPMDKAGPLGRALGLLHGRLVLAENERGLVLVDRAAAMEASLGEQLKNAFAADGVRMQPLLLPLNLDVETVVAEAAERNAHALFRVGLDIGRIGPQAVIVRQLPALLRGADIEVLARGTLAVAGASGGEPEALIAAMASNGVPPPDSSEPPPSLADLGALLRDVERLQAGANVSGRERLWTQIDAEELQRRIRNAD